MAAAGITFVLLLRFLWLWLKRVVFWFIILSLAGVILYRFVAPPFTWLMLSRAVGQKLDGHEWVMKKEWISLEKIPQSLQLAAVCSEDQNFLTHNGFDFKAIQAAIEYNRTHEDKRGASTISQQTAKNAFLWEGRSWLRKGLEVWFTALVELFWSKQRILEVYLNIIEFGPGIYGAEAAAQQYFGKSAAKLSRLESARLMSIVPSPRNWSIEGRIARARTRFILRQMNNWGGTLKFN
jgi:monofunctional biosynthetic peptidoglycan transglycosylase